VITQRREYFTLEVPARVRCCGIGIRRREGGVTASSLDGSHKTRERSLPRVSAGLIALLMAEVISATGTQITRLAIAWFVLASAGSTSQMSVLLAAQMISMALFGIPGGALAARFTARRFMRFADATRAIVIALVPTLSQLSLLSFPALLVIVMIVGAFFSPYYASQRVLLPHMVGTDERALARANALLMGAFRAAALLGPAVAGVLIATIGPTRALLVDAGSFLVAFLFITLFVRGERPMELPFSGHGVFAGLRNLGGDAVLRAWTIASCAYEMATQIVIISIPALAFLLYGGDPRIAGVLLMLFGAGALAGNTIVILLLRWFPPRRLIVIGCVAESLALWALVFDTRVATVGAVLVAAGLFVSLINGPGTAMQTNRTPETLRTQSMSAFMTLILVAGSIGLAVTGPALDVVPPRAMFGAVAVLHTVGTFFSVIAVRRADTPSGSRLAVVAPSLPS
jgi:predicted MFS family arabinose efflux permease